MAKTSGKDQPVTIDGATLALLPTPQKIDLKTADDVRLEMARLYRDMRHGKIEAAQGTKLAYVLGLLGKIIEAAPAADATKYVEEVIIPDDPIEAARVYQRLMNGG